MKKTSKKNKVNDHKSRESGLGHKLKVRVNKKKTRPKAIDERVVSNDEFIEGFEEKVENYVENYVEKVERTKRLTLVLGVTFFMILIVFLYSYSFKNQVKSIAERPADSELDYKIEQFRKDVGNVLEEYRETKEIIKNEIDSNLNEDIEEEQTEEALGLPQAEPINQPNKDSIEALKEKLTESDTTLE